jgi:hypothetical protein
MNGFETALIFTGTGVPKQTYVRQEEGRFEKELKTGLRSAGMMCLLTGPSKTGKSTLYTTVLAEMGRIPLQISCNSGLSAEEFWRKPLENIQSSRVTTQNSNKNTQTEMGVAVKGGFSWTWLATLIGEGKLGITHGHSEGEVREKILAKPSSSHLVPLLKYTNLTLVIDNFHYLTNETQKVVFQELKEVCEAQISVIVIATTHHGADLIRANQEIVGRVQHIDLARWSEVDLKKIAEKGFAALNLEFDPVIFIRIADECAGLPIIMQQTCAQLFIERDLESVDAEANVSFTAQDGWSALHGVAKRCYGILEPAYNRLSNGPMGDFTRDATYGLILAAFTKNPARFELTRQDIYERVSRSDVSSNRMASKIDRALKELQSLQESYGIQLLEWSELEDRLYVIEPSFLFYVRWRNLDTRPTDSVQRTIEALLQGRGRRQRRIA